MTETIFMTGDSLAAHKEEYKRPETGWFEKFNLYLSPNVKTKNFAFNGASTKTFLERNLLNKIDQEIKENDYLLIGFGHNDQKVEDPNWGTTIPVYQRNLQKFIDIAIKHHAIPVVLSSVVRRKFKGNNLINSLGQYPIAAKEIAQKNNILFIDLNQITYTYIKKLGPQKSLKIYLNVDHSTNYPQGIHDNTHLSALGAKIIAGMVAKKLKDAHFLISDNIHLDA